MRPLRRHMIMVNTIMITTQPVTTPTMGPNLLDILPPVVDVTAAAGVADDEIVTVKNSGNAGSVNVKIDALNFLAARPPFDSRTPGPGSGLGEGGVGMDVF